MDAYALVKSGKLKLKGHEDKPKKRKRKSSGNSLIPTTKEIRNTFGDDLAAHGGWWEISKFADIIGPVAIQMTGLAPAPECSSSSTDQPLPIPPAYYLSASDDGFINLGPPRREGEPPAPEEILTAVKVSDTKVAFKTGYVCQRLQNCAYREVFWEVHLINFSRLLLCRLIFLRSHLRC